MHSMSRGWDEPGGEIFEELRDQGIQLRSCYALEQRIRSLLTSLGERDVSRVPVTGKEV